MTSILQEYIRARLREQLIESFGTIDFDPEYDYKEERRRGNRRIPEWE